MEKDIRNLTMTDERVLDWLVLPANTPFAKSWRTDSIPGDIHIADTELQRTVIRTDVYGNIVSMPYVVDGEVHDAVSEVSSLVNVAHFGTVLTLLAGGLVPRPPVALGRLIADNEDDRGEVHERPISNIVTNATSRSDMLDKRVMADMPYLSSANSVSTYESRGVVVTPTEGNEAHTLLAGTIAAEFMYRLNDEGMDVSMLLGSQTHDYDGMNISLLLGLAGLSGSGDEDVRVKNIELINLLRNGVGPYIVKVDRVNKAIHHPMSRLKEAGVIDTESDLPEPFMLTELASKQAELIAEMRKATQDAEAIGGQVTFLDVDNGSTSDATYAFSRACAFYTANSDGLTIGVDCEELLEHASNLYGRALSRDDLKQFLYNIKRMGSNPKVAGYLRGDTVDITGRILTGRLGVDLAAKRVFETQGDSLLTPEGEIIEMIATIDEIDGDDLEEFYNTNIIALKDYNYKTFRDKYFQAVDASRSAWVSFSAETAQMFLRIREIWNETMEEYKAATTEYPDEFLNEQFQLFPNEYRSNLIKFLVSLLKKTNDLKA